MESGIQNFKIDRPPLTIAKLFSILFNKIKVSNTEMVFKQDHNPSSWSYARAKGGEMLKKIFISFFLVMTLLAFFSAFLAADDHIVEERTRTYMGRTTPPSATEMWIGENMRCYKGRSFTLIHRYDLKKRFIINHRNKKYMEEPIKESSEPAEKEKARIQTLGFDYQPVFDWVVSKTDKEKIIDGIPCRLYIFEGDADYAEEKRELWIAQDVSIDLDRYYRLIVEPDLDEEWSKVYEKNPELKHSIALESQIFTENAIAPTMTWNIKVTKIESAGPPEGLYELPEGFQKVETREELYAR